MKPIYLFTGLLAWTTLVVTSCSTPKMAQQVSIQDDVYNSTASAVVYERPAPSEAARYQDSLSTDQYGNSDPNYDMDYYSRINRFYYGGPFRSYYDPYFDGYYGSGYFSPYFAGMGMGFGMGFGMNYGYGNFWGPYSFGNYFSPYWGYMSWPYGGFMGGGYYGGGYLGGGGYYGGGYLVGNGNVNTGGRPGRGRENGIGYTNGGATRISNGSSMRPYSGGGVVLGGRSNRAGSYTNPNRGATLSTRPSNGNSSANQMGRPTRSGGRDVNQSQRPTRTESYTPTRSERPTYTPPANNGGGRSSGGSMGGGGGASRPTRGGGRG
jgi:hypothetical protein